jgi:hypothetical protein
MALGSIYFGLFAPSFFELTFDRNLAQYPLAASFAKRDPVLVNDQFGSGPVAELTYDETKADEKCLNGDATLACSAHIKKHENLAAWTAPMPPAPGMSCSRTPARSMLATC